MKWHIVATVSGEFETGPTDGKEAAARVRQWLRRKITSTARIYGKGLAVGAIQVEPVEDRND